jgi:hypothetical protein
MFTRSTTLRAVADFCAKSSIRFSTDVILVANVVWPLSNAEDVGQLGARRNGTLGIDNPTNPVIGWLASVPQNRP